MALDDRVDESTDGIRFAHIATVELIGQPVDGPARTGDDHRTLPGENRTDAGADPPHTAGDEHNAVL